ncbi:hypothetical protein B0H13DRAFT_1868430 [Mycena leptocephala]|nr:hypothetical protein B0H13DRAFT_1868430 [Mycena leptocephala]
MVPATGIGARDGGAELGNCGGMGEVTGSIGWKGSWGDAAAAGGKQKKTLSTLGELRNKIVAAIWATVAVVVDGHHLRRGAEEGGGRNARLFVWQQSHTASYYRDIPNSLWQRNQTLRYRDRCQFGQPPTKVFKIRNGCLVTQATWDSIHLICNQPDRYRDQGDFRQRNRPFRYRDGCLHTSTYICRLAAGVAQPPDSGHQEQDSRSPRSNNQSAIDLLSMCDPPQAVGDPSVPPSNGFGKFRSADAQLQNYPLVGSDFFSQTPNNLSSPLRGKARYLSYYYLRALIYTCGYEYGRPSETRYRADPNQTRRKIQWRRLTNNGYGINWEELVSEMIFVNSRMQLLVGKADRQKHEILD